LSKLLLRQGIVYSGGTPWTCVHESWLRKQRFADHHLKAAFDHSFDAVLAATAARKRLDEQILDVAAWARFTDPVNRLGCLRGISALTGLALTVEIVTGRGSPVPQSAPTWDCMKKPIELPVVRGVGVLCWAGRSVCISNTKQRDCISAIYSAR
jgi:hypothetical protein